MEKNQREIKINYEELDSIQFEDSIISKVIVNKANIKYEFLVRKTNKSDKLVIFGSGAYDFNKIKLPVFQRFSWVNDFEENLIFYNDPTLYIGEVSLAWGYGSEDEHYLEGIGDILQKLLLKININNNNTVIYGSSGGGFMALILATILKGSTAVVNNPQTNIETYYKTITEKVFKIIYPNITLKEALDRNKDRINVIEYFKKEKYVPPIIYLQNLACDFDVRNQMLPFLEGIRNCEETMITREIDLKLYKNSTQNHSPVSKEKTIRIIRETLGAKFEFDNCLEIQNSNWEVFSKRDKYNIYRYNTKLDKKSIQDNYIVKLNNRKLQNTKAKEIFKDDCCDLYGNGYLYISISNERIKKEGKITENDIKSFFSKSVVSIMF